MKCIVIETSPERTNAHTVTDDNGMPHIYDTMKDARAELKGNGYSYNRENQRYYIKGTEYRAYIIREDSDEYAEIITAANPAHIAAEAMREATEATNAAREPKPEPKPEPAAKSYTIVCITKANRTEYLHAITVEAANVTEAKKNAAAVIRDTLNRHAFALSNEGTKDANHSVNFCARRYGMTAAEVIEAARAPQGIDLYGAAPTEIVNEAMQEAKKAMEEAAEAERKTTDAAIVYDTEAAAAHAAEARRAAIAAEQAAAKAAVATSMTGASSLTSSTADIASEYAAHARQDADRATETAKQNAAEAEDRAAILATIEDPQTREYFTAHAIAHQWSAEETRANIAHSRQISAANNAARALLDAYADVIGEYPTEDDPETRAAYRVARDEVTGTSDRATEYDRETVDDVVDIIARSARRPDLSKYDSPWLVWEPAPVYQRHELDAYLGEPDDYDVSAIEAEATAYDPKTGARVWTAFGDDLAAIAERHQTAAYYPAAV